MKIIEELGPIDFTKARCEIEKGFISNIKYTQKLIKTAKNETVRMQAVRAYNDSVKTFTEYLESYGIKPKIADKLDIKHENKTLKEEYQEFVNLDLD